MAYTPKQWIAGEIITATKMNNIENQLVANDKSVIISTEAPTDNDNKIWVNGTGSHIQVATQASIQTLTDRIDNLRSDVYYTKMAITSFRSDTTQAEIGSTINEIELNYQLNKEPKVFKLNNEVQTLDPSLNGTITIPGPITSNRSWTLFAQGNGSTNHPDSQDVDEKTITLNFLNRCYYGVALMPTMPNTVDSTFVTNLTNKVLTSTKARTFTVDAKSNQYIWYCIPTRLAPEDNNPCEFRVNGFEGGFENIRKDEDEPYIEVTNSSGHVETYYVYRSTNSNLGETTVIVS